MKRDARKLTISAQQELRERGIKMRDKGMSYQDIGNILEVHHTTVSTWYAKYITALTKQSNILPQECRG